jgi:hypothetical protein
MPLAHVYGVVAYVNLDSGILTRHLLNRIQVPGKRRLGVSAPAPKAGTLIHHLRQIAGFS